MNSSILNNKKLTTFIDAGTTNLKNFDFVSKELNEQKVKSQILKNVESMPSAPELDDSEKEVQFRLNRTGNIFYSSTSAVLQDDTKDMFDSVTVLFAAMTKAISDKGKSLFDYNTWSQMISKTGYFVEVQKFEKNLEIKSNSVTIDTQVVQGLIPGLTSGSSLEIAKSVLNALNGEFKISSTDESTKLGHLLFICEELFGAPSVTVRLFFASKKSHTKVTSSPCHKSTSMTFEQLQEANTFLFVSPPTIKKYASDYGDHPEEYSKLIEKLKGYIED